MKEQIETKRLIIRDATIEDAKDILDIWDLEHHKDNPYYMHYTIEQIEDIISKYTNLETGILKVAIEKETGKVMGTCCLGYFGEKEDVLGYGCTIGVDYYGKKFISEICNAVEDYARNKLNFNKLVEGGFLNERKDCDTSFYLETDRLITRPVRPSDIDIIDEIWNDPVSLESHHEDHYSREYISDICNKTRTLSSSVMMVTILKETGEIVGTCRVGAMESPYIWDFGYYTHPSHRGKGYATELVKGIVEKAKEEKYEVRKLEAGAYKENIGSRKVLEKSGMILTNLNDEDADYELIVSKKKLKTNKR